MSINLYTDNLYLTWKHFTHDILNVSKIFLFNIR